ncbi:MAG TPA: ABC transporter ATP-binding protein [Candidatus Hydrogenedentes bacterium]|nr:ABC transporter ATP-binding protein [Candidatus Hydrogenedentota bacterium]
MAVLEVVDLKKGFVSPDGERTRIVDVPRFVMNEAEQIALQGSSGSGKTTFLNLIAGILQPDSGSISISGQELASLSEAGRDRIRAQSIGYVFQTFNLLQGYTALENVLLGMMFGRGADPVYAKALLERVGLKDRMNYRPRQLSVGQQQRVAVARALANHPKLVLADEPTGNLDYQHAGAALELIREVCREQNAALLLVTHDRDILNRFDHVQNLADINKAIAPPVVEP